MSEKVMPWWEGSLELCWLGIPLKPWGYWISVNLSIDLFPPFFLTSISTISLIRKVSYWNLPEFFISFCIRLSSLLGNMLNLFISACIHFTSLTSICLVDLFVRLRLFLINLSIYLSICISQCVHYLSIYLSISFCSYLYDPKW